jgi:hypothetical protein
MIKWGLVIKAAIIAIPLIALKVLFHYLDFEIVAVGPIITALVAGVFFVLAIILSGVLADFKESEKMPGELAASMEALYKDAQLIGTEDAAAEMLKHIKDLAHTVTQNFKRKGSWKLSEVNAALDRIDDDIKSFAEKGVAISLILKLRNEVGNIKRISNRVEVIKETAFLPAAYAIAEFAIGVVFLVFLLLKIEPCYEGLVLVGGISIIMISVVLLIKDLDNPFEGHATVDLSHLYKLDKYLDSK